MACHFGLNTLQFLESQPALQRESFFNAIFNNLSGLMITDVTGIILKVNAAFCEMSGYSVSELVGQTPRLLRSGRHDQEFYRAMFSKLADSGQWSGEVWDRHKNGQLFLKWSRIHAIKDNTGSITHYIANYVDITAEYQAQDKIHQLAFYDQLTSLPNRNLLLETTEQLQQQALLKSNWGALLLLNLDNFKLINDQFGYSLGDQYLRDFASALQSTLPPQHSLGRLDSDQFVILQPAVHDSPAQSLAAAKNLLQSVKHCLGLIQIQGKKQHITARSGLTLFGGSHQSAAELLRQAELALQQAKHQGRNKNCLYQPEMEAKANRRALLQTALETALEENQFYLHLQPQVDRSGRLLGAEALLRWQHPQEGAISPDEFIPLAEASGHIFKLGCWVLNESCRLLHSWKSHSAAQPFSLSVNVSALQFTHQDFVQHVIQTVRQYQIQPSQLKLELTESLLAEDSQDIAEKMHALKALGVGLALDDFGTGYSSLSYLRNMPFDQLKIDRSFVCDLPECSNAATITRTIATLGHSLGMSLVAEGVENIQQIGFLEELDCSIFQGYFYSRPVSVDEFKARYLRAEQI